VLRTRVTDEYGIEAPVVLAPMGFVSMPPLVAAVSNAGGLGLLGASIGPPPVLAEMIRSIRSMTSAPFGAGFLVVETAFGPGTTDEHIAVAAAERLPVAMFHWELPSRAWVDRLRGGGTRVWIQAGSVELAREAVALGADAVVCQAAEAGGHNRSATPLASLLPAMVHAVRPVPVVAAGGIGDGRALAAARVLGADAASFGTRFVASREANVHAEWQRRILAAEAGDTAFTHIFGPEWPDGRVRTLRNRVVDEWRGRDDRTPAQPEPPVCIGTTRLGDVEYRMPKFSAVLPTPETTGDFEEMCLLAGESAAVIRAVAPAGEIVRHLVADAEALLGARPLPSPGAVR